MFERKPKILVEIYTPNGFLLSKKKYPFCEDYVEIRQPRRGAGGTPYRPKYGKDCIISYVSGLPGFRQVKQKLMLIQGAERCMSFSKDGLEPALWNRQTEEEFFKASVIKAAGTTTQKIQVPTLFYVVILINIALTFVVLLVSSGRVKIN